VVGSLEVVVDSCHHHLGRRDNLDLDNKTWMSLKMVSQEVRCVRYGLERGSFAMGREGLGRQFGNTALPRGWILTIAGRLAGWRQAIGTLWRLVVTL
jgi:hypothetical protein